MFEVIDTIDQLDQHDIDMLVGYGVVSVSRYIARTSAIGKVIRKPEVDLIRSDGRLGLIINYEQAGTEWRLGYSRGFDDGMWARTYTRSLGIPDTVPIIQSIDTGVTFTEQPTAANYQRGFNDGGGCGIQGAYGPRNVLEYLIGKGLIRVAWEWMGVKGAPSSGISHIRQYRDKPYALPFTYDANTPLAAYYGQWTGGGNPPPPLPVRKDDDVAVAIQANDGDPIGQKVTFAWQPGCAIGWITSDTQLNVGLVTGALVLDSNHLPLRNFSHGEIQDMIDRYWAGAVSPFPPSFTPPVRPPAGGVSSDEVDRIVTDRLNGTKLAVVG